MAEIISSPIVVTLNNANPTLQSPVVAVGQLTDTIRVQLQRPTTANGLNWLAVGRVRVMIVFRIDGIEHVCVGSTSGGIRLKRDGSEQDLYELIYHPTVQFSGNARRIGETGATIEAYIRLERLSGTVRTTLQLASTTESAAPVRSAHNSVAYDADTSAQEIAGDGVITLSHTPVGSTNLAAHLGVGNAALAGVAGSATYDGVAMTEMVDAAFSTSYRHAGYRLAGIPTGTKNVVSTLTAGPDFSHQCGVITMTGVDQTTPVGTPATATGTTGSITVTATGVGTDDLVVAFAYMHGTSLDAAGSNQVEQWTQDVGNDDTHGAGSTKLGSFGSGVMSWGATGQDAWGIHAVAFKAAGAATTKQLAALGVG